MTVCGQCGANHPAGTAFCQYCGLRLIPQGAPPDPSPAPQPPPASGLRPLNLSSPAAVSADLTALGYLGSILLMSIPVVGWIVCLVWAFNTTGHPSRTNLARAMVAVIALQILLVFLAIRLIGGAVGAVVHTVQQTLGQIPAALLDEWGPVGSSLRELLQYLETLPF